MSNRIPKKMGLSVEFRAKKKFSLDASSPLQFEKIMKLHLLGAINKRHILTQLSFSDVYLYDFPHCQIYETIHIKQIVRE